MASAAMEMAPLGQEEKKKKTTFAVYDTVSLTNWTTHWCTNQAVVMLFKGCNDFFFFFLLSSNCVCWPKIQFAFFAAVVTRPPCWTTKVPLAQKVPNMSNGVFYVFRREQSANGLVWITNGRVCFIDSGMLWQTCHKWQHEAHIYSQAHLVNCKCISCLATCAGVGQIYWTQGWECLQA